jgi:hypothetical protein
MYTQDPKADTSNFRKLITSVMELIHCTAPYDEHLGDNLADKLLSTAVGFLSLAAMRETGTELLAALSTIQTAKRHLTRGEYRQAHQILTNNKPSAYEGEYLPLIQATSAAIQAAAIHDHKLDTIATAEEYQDAANQQNEQHSLQCYAAVFSKGKLSPTNLSPKALSNLMQLTAYSHGPTGI